MNGQPIKTLKLKNCHNRKTDILYTTLQKLAGYDTLVPANGQWLQISFSHNVKLYIKQLFRVGSLKCPPYGPHVTRHRLFVILLQKCHIPAGKLQSPNYPYFTLKFSVYVLWNDRNFLIWQIYYLSEPAGVVNSKVAHFRSEKQRNNDRNC